MPSELTDPAVDAELLEEDSRPSLSPSRILAYCISNLGNGMFWAFNNASMSLWLGAFTANPLIISLLSASHSFEGVIIQPLMGSFSDRLRTRWGKRRPVIAIAIPISCLFMVLTPLASHLPPSIRLGTIIFSVVMFSLTFNIANDPYQSLLADSTNPKQRGRVIAFWFIMNAAGQVFIPLLNIAISWKFVVVALVMLLTTLITVLFTPERSTEDAPAIRAVRKRETFKKEVQGLRTLHQVRFFLLMGFFYGAGTDALVPNLTRFIKIITHCSDQDAQNVFTVLVLSMGLTMIPCGWIADKVGPKRMLIAGVLLVGVASLCGLWVKTLPEIRAVMILAGVATACQNASQYPLLTRLVPTREIGFYTGLLSAALAVAGPMAIVITGRLTQAYGYRVIFDVCAVCTLLAMMFLALVSMAAARGEIVKRDTEVEAATSLMEANA